MYITRTILSCNGQGWIPDGCAPDWFSDGDLQIGSKMGPPDWLPDGEPQIGI